MQKENIVNAIEQIIPNNYEITSHESVSAFTIIILEKTSIDNIPWENVIHMELDFIKNESISINKIETEYYSLLPVTLIQQDFFNHLKTIKKAKLNGNTMYRDFSDKNNEELENLLLKIKETLTNKYGKFDFIIKKN